jgi:predicted ATPase
MFLNSSQRQPLVIAVENLHWIDQTSEACFASLIGSMAAARILVLATYRPGYRPPWIEKSYATQMVLQPLSSRDSRQMLRSVLQRRNIPDPLTQMILAKAQGNPFFLEEIVRALVEQGVLGRADAVGATGRSLLPTEIQIPPTVHGLLAARIDRLPAEEKALLQTLAVIGSTFRWRLITKVIDQPEEALRQQLAALQAGEFLYEQPAWPECAYAFKHVLTQDVAYTSMPRERRRSLHERAAQAIEMLFEDRLEEHYGELAHHYRHSGNTEKAVAYLQRAGQQAVQRSAYAEAISDVTTALELLKILPDTAGRTRQEFVLQTTLGEALIATKGYAAPEVAYAFTRARELSQQMGETPQLNASKTPRSSFKPTTRWEYRCSIWESWPLAEGT